MKICILTGKFGMGHYSAAQAIKQQIDESGMKADVEIIDWLSYALPKLAEKYYTFYSFLVKRGSSVYNHWYRSSEDKNGYKKPELSLYFQGCFSKLLKEKKPDLIISTLPLCSQIVSLYKEKTPGDLPLVTCVTDITGHSEWICKNTAFYLVGSRSVKERFIQKGVTPNRILVTGIPVRSAFQKDSFVNHSEISLSGNKILLMGGCLGMLPNEMDFYKSLNSLPDTETKVITAKNQKLYEKLNGRYKNIRVYGYVDNIWAHMERSDLIITKPGGITTFEAIHSKLPILALNPYMQQEIYNAQFIEENQIGEVVHGDSDQCLKVLSYILYSGRLEEYKDNIHRMREQLKSESISQILKSIIYIKNQSASHLTNQYPRINKEISLHEKISFNI